MAIRMKRVAALAASLMLAAGCGGPKPEVTADTIFAGDVLTINDAQPSVEAIAVKDGNILAIGTRRDIESASKGANTKVVDLAGKTLLPGFLDPHSHYINSLSVANQVNVFAPPAGPGKDVGAIVAELRKFRDARNIPAGELIIAYGYDESSMPDGHMLNRGDLDRDFPDHPVLVGHVSLHGAVLNTAALRKFGFSADRNRVKLGGVKITLDGSPQGRTAFFTTPYLVDGPDGQKGWKGELPFPQEQVDAWFRQVYGNNLQLFVHANGDAAIDVLLRAHATAAVGGLDKDRRTTVIHSQFVRPDQLDSYVKYKLIPSLFTEHTFYFGDTHVKQRGKTQAYFLSPMRTRGCGPPTIPTST